MFQRTSFQWFTVCGSKILSFFIWRKNQRQEPSSEASKKNQMCKHLYILLLPIFGSFYQSPRANERLTFFWRWSRSLQSLFRTQNFMAGSASKKWCKPTAHDLHHHAFHGAAKACTLVFCISAHLDNRWTFLSAMNGESMRARARRVGVRGSLARIKARTNNGAVAASLSPRKGQRRPQTVQAQVVKWVCNDWGTKEWKTSESE